MGKAHGFGSHSQGTEAVMPFMENDRVTVTDPNSAYYGKFGTVLVYWSELECPVAEVKLDGFLVPATFSETSIAIGEHVIRPLAKYEYNIQAKGQPFYANWCEEWIILEVWDSTTFEQAKTKLPEGWKFIKRIKPVIEDV
jgi:hypothetical protein